MRDKMTNQADARNVLRFLGRNGYTEVETAGHYDWTASQFRTELDRAGLKAISGHDGPDFNFPANWQDAYKTTLEYAAALGQKYTGWAWFPGPYDDVNKWKDLADKFNESGVLAKQYGLQFFYHNHNFEFENKQADGTPVYDILLEECDRNLVKFELDLFWITEGGANGVDYLKSDPARFWAYHVKDHVWASATARRTRGRRAGHARLPGPVRRRRRPRARQALLHRARPAVAVAPERPGGRVQDRGGRDPVSGVRALVRKSSCRRVSPASSGWNAIASTLPCRTATG
jgi:sugar phosphate isomerase/epimerase